MKNTEATQTITCDSNFPQCKRNAKVTFEAIKNKRGTARWNGLAWVYGR